MLRRFSVTNFRSFREEVTLDLTLTGRDRGQGFSHVEGTKRKPLYSSTAAGIFGANASGKSNMLLALQFACDFVRASAYGRPDKDIPILTWFNSSEPCQFRLEWSKGKDIFSYELHVTRDAVEYERLSLSDVSAPGDSTTLFSRKYNKILEVDSIFKVINDQLLRKNVSFIAYSHQQGMPEEFTGVSSLASPCLFNPDGDRLPLIMRTGISLQWMKRILKSEKKSDFLSWIIPFLRECDIGLQNIEIEEAPSRTEEDGGAALDLYGVHETAEGTKLLNFKWESEGTRVLLSYLIYIFLCIQGDGACFNGGGILFIDEFDSALHPDMQLRILSFFDDEEKNPDGAQIIFTTHAAQLMNSLGKAHIYLCEKKDNSSDFWRLDEMEGVKASDNFTRKYLGGQYGAVPI